MLLLKADLLLVLALMGRLTYSIVVLNLAVIPSSDLLTCSASSHLVTSTLCLSLVDSHAYICCHFGQPTAAFSQDPLFVFL